MLSRLVIDILPSSKSLLISWLQSPSAVILELKKINLVTASTFSPIFFIYHHYFTFYSPSFIFTFYINGTGRQDLSFLTLSFKPAFSLSSFTLIKRLFGG